MRQKSFLLAMASGAGSLALLMFIGTIIGYGQISSFQHIVVIVQENRTPDNLFQGLCNAPFGSAAICSTQPSSSQYNIQTKDWKDKTSLSGKRQPGTVLLAGLCDLAHSHNAFTAMCDADQTGACRMDGAAGIPGLGPCLPNPQFRYVDNSKGVLNPYLELATQYGWANYMFQTNQGPSFPAHQFLFGATSSPNAVQDAAGVFVAENPSPYLAPGCTSNASATVALIDSSGSEKQSVYPCFEHSTVADILPPAITWKYYATGNSALWTAPLAIQHICQSTGPGGTCSGLQWANVDHNPADVLTDIANCNLPSVTWVTPTGFDSDHAGTTDGSGPSWVASVVNAIGSSTACDGNNGYWNNTAIVITWDDWGGWYDHEPPRILPPPQGAFQYGFRVPLLVVSAYTPAGYIDNTRHDFGSLVRFIEHNFGVQEGVLNFSDARASDNLGGFFRLSGAPRGFQTINAPLDANFFINDTRLPTDPDDD